ncbi:MAG: FHA domain-containing protein, partial [Planctomycetota bacterium]
MENAHGGEMNDTEAVLTLEGLIRHHGRTEKEKFLARFTDPCLLVELLQKKGREGEFQTLHGEEPTERPTAVVPSKENMARVTLVMPVAKSDRNTFGNMVTIGRAKNNDIMIQFASVSKFHAYIRMKSPRGPFSLADAGSSYGTRLEDRALRKDEPVPLESGGV